MKKGSGSTGTGARKRWIQWRWVTLPSGFPPSVRHGLRELLQGRHLHQTERIAVREEQKMSKRKTVSRVFVVQLFFILIFMGAAIAAPPLNIPNKGPQFVHDELIVKFKPGVSDREIDAINVSHGTSVLSVNPIARFMRLRIHGKGRSVQQLVKRYRGIKKVEYAEPNYIVHASLVPNDLDFLQLWGLDNTGQTGGTPEADISAPEAWDIQTGDSAVVVAVIDSGVDYNHQDLAANMWTNPGEIPGNGIDDDANGYIDDVRGWDFVSDDNDPFDDNSHGTHVAGTIAAVGNNEIGVVGVNWRARIMPLKFLDAYGNGTIADAVGAIQYATLMGARLTNNSWGGAGYSQALRDAITAADAAGTLFIAAAGNSGTNNDVSPFYPAGYDVPNIIAVAATDHNDNLAGFSNYGPSSVHLGAPGVSIFSTTPNDTYGYKNGTSMATPHVSGGAALLMAELPALTHLEIKERMLNAVDPVASLKGMVLTGGRLNANDALLGVVPPEPPAPTSVFEDDIESGTNGWTVSGGTSLWHQSSNRYVSPVTSWYYGIEGVFNYDTGGRNLGSITSPPIDLTGLTDAKLVFSHFLDTEESSRYDKALVRISNDGGITFTDVFTRLTTTGAFVQENLNIAAFDGDIIQIQFFFDTVDSVFNGHEGWYVDDVEVTGQVAVPPPNIAPTADAGLDQTVGDDDGDGTESVTVDGSGSFDPDGVIVAYEWKEGDTVLGTTAIITGSFAVGSHTVTLRVTDDGGATRLDDVIVTVNPNQPPTADAGPDQTVGDDDGDGTESVTVDGSGSFDPDGVIVAYEWKEGDIVLGTTAIITGSFAVGLHTLSLTVTDNGGATDTNTVLITVNAAPPSGPTIHISNIDITLLKRGPRYNARGLVSIVDDTGMPIQGITVAGEWTLNGAFIMQASEETNKEGVANLDSGKVSTQSGDILTITIINVSKEGFTYDPTENVETSDWVKVP